MERTAWEPFYDTLPNRLRGGRGPGTGRARAECGRSAGSGGRHTRGHPGKSMGLTPEPTPMSDARTPADGDDVTISESDGWIVARDEDTGVSSQGETKAEALENLADALRLYHRPVPKGEDVEEPSDAPWL
jgi:predicted RNase H-like HicB family nuclease